jgi:hypothetical protein
MSINKVPGPALQMRKQRHSWHNLPEVSVIKGQRKVQALLPHTSKKVVVLKGAMLCSHSLQTAFPTLAMMVQVKTH